MIANPILLWILFAGAALLSAAALAPFVIPRLTRLWRQATPLGRFVFVIATVISTLYGGTKTNDVDSAGESSTNLLMTVFRRMLRSVEPAPAVTPEGIARGWQRISVTTNGSPDFAMPDGATLATNWWRRGAFEDVTPVGDLWVHTWGKVLFALNDPTNGIAAVGVPMSAVPFRSRLWSAAGTNGSFLVTWEDFLLGRNTNTPVSAQVELWPNGDYIVRSNEVESAWRRIDPDDFDGDGYLNDDDGYPYEWNEGADDYYGPYNDLPWDCNEDAYCSVTVKIGGRQSQWVTFTGDGFSDYSDPQFYAKPNVPYDVKILIGKSYRATCDAPIRAVGTSDDEIVVSDVSSNAFTVVWPVTITEAPRLFAAPPRGLLGGSRGNTGFTMDVYPSWLDGVFEWGTNACCQIVDNGDWWSFSCEDGCTCNGCLIGGGYTYEGYTLGFSGVRCGCDYRANLTTRWGIAAPDLLFKDGAPRPLNISFYHGDPDYPEEGTLTLQVNDGGRIQIWEDEEKTSAASTFSWDVSSFNGHAFYLEGIGASDSVGDITFDLTWTRPGGSSVTYTATTTCAEVKETQVTSSLPDGSPNPPPFDGSTSWDFDVTHSPYPDKHFSVLYRDAVNTNDLSVRDFTVAMTLVVQPTNAPVGAASWFALDPTPGSGQIVSAADRVGELRNPKVGGVYHIGACFAGSPTNECSIVLPLAGAEMAEILRGDLEWADRFASTGKEHLPKRWIERVKFGCKWFVWLENGYYRGRPDNRQHPTVWYYNQVDDFDGLGAIGTLFGRPIRVEKLSNFISGYACVKIGVPWSERVLAQAIGAANDLAATLSWQAGEDVANGTGFDSTISNFLENAHLELDEKTSRLWPNTAPVDNHRGHPGHGDFDREFSSPGFIYAQP